MTTFQSATLESPLSSVSSILSGLPFPNHSEFHMTSAFPMYYDTSDINGSSPLDGNATSSSNPFCPDVMPDSSYFVNAPYLISELIVAVLAIIGNSLTIMVFVKNRKLRRLTNYYIVSLAAADLLVGILGIPFAILTSLGMPEAREPCLMMLCTLILLCTISIFSLVGVSVDRYWAILHPLIYARLMTASRARRIILLCWVLGTIIGLMPLFGWHLECKLCLFTAVIDPNYLVFLYFTTIVGPGILMAFFYCHIFSVVIKQLRQIVQQEAPAAQLQPPTPDQEGPAPSSTPTRGNSNIPRDSIDTTGYSPRDGRSPNAMLHTNRREVKAAKNLSIIVLFFMVCWFPLYTINCINAFCPTCYVPLQLLNFTIILSHANSAINPLLYAYHMKDFRYALKALLWQKRFGVKMLKHRPSTALYRAHQTNRNRQRQRPRNGHELISYDRRSPSRSFQHSPMEVTPTNLTPLSLSCNRTPTDHPLHKQFYSATLKPGDLDANFEHNDVSIIDKRSDFRFDSLKRVNLPRHKCKTPNDYPSELVLSTSPLIQISTCNSPSENKEDCLLTSSESRDKEEGTSSPYNVHPLSSNKLDDGLLHEVSSATHHELESPTEQCEKVTENANVSLLSSDVQNAESSPGSTEESASVLVTDKINTKQEDNTKLQHTETSDL